MASTGDTGITSTDSEIVVIPTEEKKDDCFAVVNRHMVKRERYQEMQDHSRAWTPIAAAVAFARKEMGDAWDSKVLTPYCNASGNNKIGAKWVITPEGCRFKYMPPSMPLCYYQTTDGHVVKLKANDISTEDTPRAISHTIYDNDVDIGPISWECIFVKESKSIQKPWLIIAVSLAMQKYWWG